MKQKTWAIIVFYNNEWKILLQERGSYSKIWEEWAFFGGWVEVGETPLEGFFREAREELGLDMKDFDYKYIWEQVQYYPERQWLINRHFYLIKTDKKENDFHVFEWIWCKYFTFEEAETLKLPLYNKKMFDFIAKYMKKPVFPVFRKIDYLDDEEIQKFMNLRKKSLLEDEGKYNFMTTYEDEKDFTIIWYKKYEYLKDYFCLEIEGKMMWYIAYYKPWKTKKQWQHIFNIWPIYIDSDYSGKWYGKFLLESMLDFLIQSEHLPLIKFVLSVNKESKIPYNLYKSVWFEEVGINKNFIRTKEWKYLDVIDMTKLVYL